jgi:ATP-GRASP peptide maturase of grasp-with-spasm system
MILILSRSVSETSTNKVIDYLISSKTPFFRFNGEDLINEKLKINFFYNKAKNKWEFEIFSQNDHITSNCISAVWYRRDFFDELEKLSDEIVINNFFKNEIRKAYDLFYISLKEKIWINKPNEVKNKLNIIAEAYNAGLNIPNSFVTNNLSFLKSLVNDDSLITKPISEGIGIVKDGKRITTFTNIVDINKVAKEVEEYMIPSLFQSLIEKEYEVRTFYFFEKCYSIAIFSQKDEKTKIDFRDYNNETPNKMSRYKLPDQIEEKVKILMNQLDMNSGSIDFIRDKKGEYTFLEINPIGQFDFVEIKGNYNLAEIVSNKLIELYEKEQR